MIKKFNKEDYDMIVNWWKAYEWPNIPPYDALPSDGFIYYKNDKPISASFLYITSNAPWGVLTWCVTNREFSKEDRLNALNEVVKYTTEYAKSRGIKYLHSFNSQEAIINALEYAGFQKCEKDCTIMTWGSGIDFMKDDHYFPFPSKEIK